MIDYITGKAKEKAARVAKKLSRATFTGYSNESNPFRDANLNEKFVWNKKIERDIVRGVPLSSLGLKAAKKRQRELMVEFDKLKRSKDERMLEKARREEVRLALERERSRAEVDDLEEFEFRQSKIRTRIRLSEGRAKPIDVLANYLDNGVLRNDYELNEPPYVVFRGLSIPGLEEVCSEIRMYLRFDNATESHTRYWEAVMVVCESELSEARRRDAIRAEVFAEERGVHKSVEADVQGFLTAQSYKELVALENQIALSMRTGEAKEVEYWEVVHKRIRVLKAKASLKEFHDKLMLQRQPLKHGHEKQVQDNVFNSEKVTMPEAEEGSLSPRLFDGDLTEEEMALDPEDDRAKLENQRSSIAKAKEQMNAAADAKASKFSRRKDEFELKVESLMSAAQEVDSVFSAEVNLDCSDKYKPRKPKYFNRVHTGYEWNKYNRTHYDSDNPPPKFVQGYKFNIFYPDLIDTTKTPIFSIREDGDRTDTCIIRFQAGPPYEDIAFRIVNREWECSPKKGFKKTFDRGILQLYFNFKRYRYRR